MAKLINEKTGQEIKTGDNVTCFRGTEYKLVSFTEPHKPSSTGRVYVEPVSGEGMRREFFPSVIGAKIVDHQFS
jgi:hypothetical protein